MVELQTKSFKQKDVEKWSAAFLAKFWSVMTYALPIAASFYDNTPLTYHAASNKYHSTSNKYHAASNKYHYTTKKPLFNKFALPSQIPTHPFQTPKNALLKRVSQFPLTAHDICLALYDICLAAHDIRLQNFESFVNVYQDLIFYFLLFQTLHAFILSFKQLFLHSTLIFITNCTLWQRTQLVLYLPYILRRLVLAGFSPRPIIAAAKARR